MKKNLLTAAAASLIIALLLTTCFTDWQDDEATLTILTNGDSPRVLVNIDDNEQASFSYELILTGPAGKKTFQFAPGAPLSVKVIPGKWNIEVRAIGPLPSSLLVTNDDNQFPNPTLRAFGEWDGIVGRDIAVPVTMYSAMEVTSMAQLAAVLDATLSSPNEKRKEIILLKNGLSAWEAGNGEITIHRPIELRAVEPVTLTRTDTGSSVFFRVTANGILTLKGSLILDGNKEINPYNSTPLIIVSDDGGDLIMYDGVTLQNNIVSNSPGGSGVLMNGGNFTMYGGTIKGNSVGDIQGTNAGGGVLLNGGTFTMYDGTIKGNDALLGGGVCVFSGTFKMMGGNINGNISYGDGGGVALNSFSGDEVIFNMSGGRIHGNTANNGNSIYGAPPHNITIFGHTYADTSPLSIDDNIPF